MDASGMQVGQPLFQVYLDEEDRPIKFWFMSLNSHIKDYSVVEKDHPAIVWAIQTLRFYIQGTHFTVYFYQASLRCFFEISKPNCTLMRWGMHLSKHDLDVQFKKWLLSTQVDALFFCLQ